MLQFSPLLSQSGDPVSPLEAADAWKAVGRVLVVAIGDEDVRETTQTTIEQAGKLLEQACRTDEKSQKDELRTRTRATALDVIAERLFGAADNREHAVNALTMLRSASDYWRQWFGPDAEFLGKTATFRFHAFLRAIEGLFASPRLPVTNASTAQRLDAYFMTLDVERGKRLGPPDGKGRKSRFFELLYCESCGVLLFGGMRGRNASDTVELLPMILTRKTSPSAQNLKCSKNFRRRILQFFSQPWNDFGRSVLNN